MNGREGIGIRKRKETSFGDFKEENAVFEATKLYDDDDGLLYMLGTEVILPYCIISVECACDWLPSPRLGI